VRITDIEVITFRSTSRRFPTRWGYSTFAPAFEVPQTLTTIVTDEGALGRSLGGDVAIVERIVKPLLVGENPLDRERLWQWMYAHTGLNEYQIGIIDMALWDLLGQITGLPIHKLLGGCRDKVKAYASTYPNMGTPDDYASFAQACQQAGYQAYKIHPYIYYDPVRQEAAPAFPTYPKHDVEICRAVRERVGDDMVLMLDPWGVYTLEQALWVGRELEKLDFYWLEHPMPEARTEAYVRLCAELTIPICSPEWQSGGPYERAEWLLRRASDMSRIDVYHGGITACIKTAALCEAFGVKCEIHGGGFGNLQVLGATSEQTCEYYERGLLRPEVDYETPPPHLKALCDPIDNDGNVHIPQTPGLGMDLDWDYIRDNRMDL